MLGLAQTQTTTPFTHLLPAQNQSLAKHNRKPSQLTENNHQRSKSIASFCRVFLDYSLRRNSPPTFRCDALPAARCIPARPCASIRVSAGSCAQPPGGGAVMMFASHYTSDWTSVLSLCEMPIRSGACAKSRAGIGFIVAHACGRFVPDGHSWRSEDRRYRGQVKRQGNGARLKAAATNSTATSTPGNFRVSNCAFPLSALHLTEVKNEKLQH